MPNLPEAWEAPVLRFSLDLAKDSENFPKKCWPCLTSTSAFAAVSFSRIITLPSPAPFRGGAAA